MNRSGSPPATPPQCEKHRDAEGEQPERRRFRERYDGPDAGAAVRLVRNRIRHITRPDDGRQVPEVGRLRRHGRVRQIGHFDVLQLRVWPRVATRRLWRRVIVMRVIRERARVRVMTRHAVRVQHGGEEKRGDHGYQCTNHRSAQGMVRSTCVCGEPPSHSSRLVPMPEYTIAPGGFRHGHQQTRMRQPAPRSSRGLTNTTKQWGSTEQGGAQSERRYRTK